MRIPFKLVENIARAKFAFRFCLQCRPCAHQHDKNSLQYDKNSLAKSKTVNFTECTVSFTVLTYGCTCVAKKTGLFPFVVLKVFLVSIATEILNGW